MPFTLMRRRMAFAPYCVVGCMKGWPDRSPKNHHLHRLVTPIGGPHLNVDRLQHPLPGLQNNRFTPFNSSVNVPSIT